MSAQSVILSIGHTRKFPLPSSAGTGYVWMLAELPSGAWLEGIEDSGAGVPGGTTTRTFVIYGAREGAGTLRFVLARPWEPLNIADQRSYAVQVRHGGTIIPLYAAALQEAKASGDTARMRQLAAQAEQQLGSSADIAAALSDVKAELGKGPTLHPLYGGAIQDATRSGDLTRMKTVAAEARAHADDPEVAAALPALEAAIAGHEHNTSWAVPPYGVAIQQAIARGDVDAMQRTKADAEKHIADLQRSLKDLDTAIGDGKHPHFIPLYAVSLQQALASGDLARMRSAVAQAEALSDPGPEIKSALAQVKAHLGKVSA